MIDLINTDRARDRRHMETWLSRPHVSKWWGDPAHRLAFFETTAADGQAIIAQNGAPIGYVSWEVVDMDDLHAVGLDDIPEGSIDIDIFIGEPDALGQGAGPAALEILADRLQKTTSAPLLGLCTSVENKRAQAAFGKAGFSRTASFDDPEYGPCYVYTRPLR